MRGAVQLRAVLVESCLTFSLILHFLQHTHLLLHLIETRALTYILAHACTHSHCLLVIHHTHTHTHTHTHPHTHTHTDTSQLCDTLVGSPSVTTNTHTQGRRVEHTSWPFT